MAFNLNHDFREGFLEDFTVSHVERTRFQTSKNFMHGQFIMQPKLDYNRIKP